MARSITLLFAFNGPRPTVVSVVVVAFRKFGTAVPERLCSHTAKFFLFFFKISVLTFFLFARFFLRRGAVHINNLYSRHCFLALWRGGRCRVGFPLWIPRNEQVVGRSTARYFYGSGVSNALHESGYFSFLFSSEGPTKELYAFFKIFF